MLGTRCRDAALRGAHVVLRFSGESVLASRGIGRQSTLFSVASEAKSTTCLGHSVMGGGGIYRRIGFIDLFGFGR